MGRTSLSSGLPCSLIPIHGVPFPIVGGLLQHRREGLPRIMHRSLLYHLPISVYDLAQKTSDFSGGWHL
ncbi:MAG: hypothetical protein ACK56I_07490, partial [bacterium]